MTQKIDYESQNFTIFDDFYSTDPKTQKLFNGLVVGFGPKGNPGRACAIVCVKSEVTLTVKYTAIR